MQYERFKQFLFQSLVQAGLEPLDYHERLDTTDLGREMIVTAILPGRAWPARALAEFSYHWSAGDTARSQGEVEPDPLGEVIDLLCTLKYTPIEDEYTVQVTNLDTLRAFMREMVDKLPLALKDEAGGNSAEARLLIGEGDELLMSGPLEFQLDQLIDLEEEDEGENGGSAAPHDIEATLRDLAADTLRGLMALDALQPPAGLFTRLPEEPEDEFADEDGEN